MAEKPEHPFFARLYDRAMAGTERAGLGDMRASLLAEANGRTLEIGAGTGANLPHYTGAVSELILAEPDPHMAKRLRERLQSEPVAAERVKVVEVPGEELPFDDDSFDTVVSTLVLCTVGDQRRSLAEIRRVLVEGGALLFIEHVRSRRPRLAWWQDRLERPHGFIAAGCHPNRPTDAVLADSGFWIDRLDRGRLPKAPPWVRPLISGVARRPEAVRR
jgi:ubiquinone/menaquinone biosynthesis C-methylase UbiE